MQETRVQSMGQEDPWRRKRQPTPVSLVGNPMDRGAWQAAVPWGHEVWDRTEQLNNNLSFTGPASCLPHAESIMSCLKATKRTSLIVQWLIFHTPNAGVPGSIPGQGTRSHMPQLRVHLPQLRICIAKQINIKKKKQLSPQLSSHHFHQWPLTKNTPQSLPC